MSFGLALLLFSSASASAPIERRPADAVVEAARAAVERRLKIYSKTELVVTGQPIHLTALKSGTSLRAQPVTGRWPRSRFTVDVQIAEPGRPLRVIPVGFALAAYAPVWMYRENLSRHARVDQLQLEQETVDVAGIESTVVADPGEFVGQRLRHAVRAGHVVREDDFETIPDIDDRQQITVKAAFGAITVESVGTAMKSGNKGDVVTVRVKGANEAVKAMVIDKGVVQVVP